MNPRPLVFLLTLMLAGCDNIAAIMADPRVAQRESDAKAIGGACRFGLRSIEDCYALNEKASKSAVFTGWKDMDQYMRDNKVEGITAKIVKPDMPTEETVDTTKSDKAAEDGAVAKSALDAKGKTKEATKEPAKTAKTEKAAASQ